MSSSERNVLLGTLRQHIKTRGAETPLGAISVFHCTRPQLIKRVPIHHPSLIIILSGKKHVLRAQQPESCKAGSLLLLPAPVEIDITNEAEPGSDYLALALSFSPDILQQFQQLYGPWIAAQKLQARWTTSAPEGIYSLLIQWVELCQKGMVNPQLLALRQLEMLWLLTDLGVSGNLLISRSDRWAARTLQILQIDPAHPWKLSDVCKRLATSESSLRRNLSLEQTSFRQLLEDVRLLSGLSLLQETNWAIQRVALTVGYQSQSRFGERFKKRFGLSPRTLRNSRVSEQGENLVENIE